MWGWPSEPCEIIGPQLKWVGFSRGEAEPAIASEWGGAAWAMEALPYRPPLVFLVFFFCNLKKTFTFSMLIYIYGYTIYELFGCIKHFQVIFNILVLKNVCFFTFALCYTTPLFKFTGAEVNLISLFYVNVFFLFIQSLYSNP